MGNHFLQDGAGEVQLESGIGPEILNYGGLLLPPGMHRIINLGVGVSFEGMLGMWSSRKNIQHYHCQ